MRERLTRAIGTYNEVAGSDERVKGLVEGKERLIEIRLGAGETYNFLIEGTVAHPLRDGAADGPPDILIRSDAETLEAIFAGTLSPVKAMATGRLILKAPIMDLLLLRNYFSRA